VNIRSTLQWCWSLLLSVALIGPGSKAAAPQRWAVYHADHRNFPIVIDGNLSEWKNVPGFTMDQPKFLFVGQGMSAKTWRGPRDLSATFKLVWDEAYIYVAVHVVDDHVTEPHGALVKTMATGSWDDDGVELMFDNNGSQMSRYYIGDTMHHEFHFVFSEKHPFVFDNFWKYQKSAPQPMFLLPDGGKEPLAYPDEVLAKNDITARFGKPPYDGAFAFKRTTDGYNLEVRMRLPGATMRAITNGGKRIGFDVSINDNDVGGGPLKQQLHWSGISGLYWRDTKLFGSLYLVDTEPKSRTPHNASTSPQGVRISHLN
jgi:hypothetical protein